MNQSKSASEPFVHVRPKTARQRPQRGRTLYPLNGSIISITERLAQPDNIA